MKNKIEDLRNHLFATLEALQDKDDPMPIDRARAIADVAKVLVDSAKAETDFLRVVGGEGGTGFIPEDRQPAPRPRGVQGPGSGPRAVGHG